MTCINSHHHFGKQVSALEQGIIAFTVTIYNNE